MANGKGNPKKDGDDDDDHPNNNEEMDIGQLKQPPKPSPRRTRSSRRQQLNNKYGPHGGGNNNNDNFSSASAASAARGSTSNVAVGRKSNNDDNNGSTNNNNNNVDAQLSKLLSRLQREHTANNNSSKVNKTRARYLLEASAGNVGLASALYWEDYIANDANNNNNEQDDALNDSNDGGEAGSSSNSVASASSTAAQWEGRIKSKGKKKPPPPSPLSNKKRSEAGERLAMELAEAQKKSRESSSPSSTGATKRPPTRNNKKRKSSDDDFDDDGWMDIPKKRIKHGMNRTSTGRKQLSVAAHPHLERERLAAMSRKRDSTGGSGSNNSSMESSSSSSSSPGKKKNAAPSSSSSRDHSSTLSSMHQFQQQLDEKISTLQDRLSSYRSRLDASAAAAHPRNPLDSGVIAGERLLAAAAARAGGFGSGSGLDNNFAAASSARRGSSEMEAAIASALRVAEQQFRGSSSSSFGNNNNDGNSSSNNNNNHDGDLAALLYSQRSTLRELGLSPGRMFGAPGGSSGSGVARAAGASGGGDLPDVDPPQLNYHAFLEALRRSEGSSGGDKKKSSARTAGAGGGKGGDGDDDDSDDDDTNSSGNGKSGRDERGDQDGDDSNSSNSRNNARDEADNNDDDAGGEAPLRRSMRLRSQRGNPRQASAAEERRRSQQRAAVARAALRRAMQANDDSDSEEVEDAPQPPPRGGRRAQIPARRPRGPRAPLAAAAAAANNNNVNEVGASEDESDITFLPGPVPVFKLKANNENESRSVLLSGQKRKNPTSRIASLLGKDDDDLDDEPEDINLLKSIDTLLHKSLTEFSEPSSELWGSYPRHSEDSDDSDDDSVQDRVNIPISWLRSGFSLSKCGNGLAVSAPSDDEWDRTRRTASSVLREGPLKGVRGLFPYNCKGVSALQSIVTALIYSGVSLQGNSTVSCDRERESFDSLSLEQRKREFDPRLVDALSSLIFVAAQAGSRRCLEILEAYKKQWARRLQKGFVPTLEEEDLYTVKCLELQRRARVANVCWWETDTSNGNVILPAGKDPKDVNFKTSLTNIMDIKSFVKTTLNSFKSAGGCALLLETILRCHGPTLSLPNKLLDCHCSEAIKHLEKNVKNKCSTVATSEVPDCMSVELLSLLLTGEIHSDYENWSADAFGIGLLRMNKNNTATLGNRLLRPVKPIWLCLSELGYSVVFLDMKNFIGSTNSIEEPGRAFQMAHWNVWSGERTGFRVITSMYDGQQNETNQLSLGVIPDDSDSEDGRTVKDSISTRLHLEHKRDAEMPWKQHGIFNAIVNPDLKPITDEELNSVSSHPEDEKYYPKQYRRWRFHFGKAEQSSTVSSTTMSSGVAVDDEGWIPFYRLHGRQRLIVEMKLAPKICSIVRSRWPLATVRDFTPAGKAPIV